MEQIQTTRREFEEFKKWQSERQSKLDLVLELEIEERIKNTEIQDGILYDKLLDMRTETFVVTKKLENLKTQLEETILYLLKIKNNGI